MLLLDLAGSMGHMSMDGELYEDQAKSELLSGDPSVLQAHSGWDTGPIEVMQTGPPIEKPKYIRDLDENAPSTSDPAQYAFHDTVQSWSEFTYTRYHPRSMNAIQRYKYSAAENEFDTFTLGRAVWAEDHLNESLMDNTRMYLEESNNCQGFQMLFDCIDGFAGIAIKCQEELEDEYGKSLFSIPLIPPRVTAFKNCESQLSKSIRTVNIALTFASMIENSTSLFLPLSTMETCWRDVMSPRKFDGVNYLPENFYQTSAILASYLDTLSLKYRLNSSTSTNLTGFCTDLSNYGRKLCAGGLAMPFPMNNTEDLIECLDRSQSKLFTDISPNCNIGSYRVVQSMCLRGVPDSRLKQPLKTSREQSQMAAYRCESSSEMMQLFYQCLNHASLSHCSTAQSGLVCRVPFPMDMFDARISSNGFAFNKPGFLRDSNEYVQSFPLLATAQNSNDLADMLSSLNREAERIKIDKLYRFKETGLDPDEYKEALEKLLDFQDLYEEKYDL